SPQENYRQTKYSSRNSSKLNIRYNSNSFNSRNCLNLKLAWVQIKIDFQLLYYSLIKYYG
ncbi:MAG TPA: hypothetical protein PK520_08765, partial [Exilispira sp.]|nr:hypothetical protein [Exilispira sp.]